MRTVITAGDWRRDQALHQLLFAHGFVFRIIGERFELEFFGDVQFFANPVHAGGGGVDEKQQN
ncbi:MAG: hypothetical protein K2W93_15975, partial [Burkholderiaceae bacterium]|nr:hypothetical protein [Burkholderiaceae bacterium]